MPEEMKATSVANYLELVKHECGDLQKEDEIIDFWFRGESNLNVSTPLAPKAYRTFGGPLNKKKHNDHVFEQAELLENNLRVEFTREATPHLMNKGVPRTSWNDYFFMQHYGLRTRLLDWTGSALTALFFAVSDKQVKKDDAIVWVLNPHRLNIFTTSKLHFENKGYSGIIASVLSIENSRNPLFNEFKILNLDELTRRYLELDFQATDTNNDHFPLAIMPPLLDERMANQQSCFTIFGNMVNGIFDADNHDDFLGSIIISDFAKKGIQEELRKLGITYKTIYPNLEGVCKSIEDKYNIDDNILKK